MISTRVEVLVTHMHACKHAQCGHLRKHSAVISHDDLVQDGKHHTAIHLDLFGGWTEHLSRENKTAC